MLANRPVTQTWRRRGLASLLRQPDDKLRDDSTHCFVAADLPDFLDFLS